MREIVSIQAFQGAGGGFDRESYRFALEQAGLNEAEFEASIRAETAASLVQDAALSGVSAPQAQVDTVLSYLGERRSLAFAMLDRGDLRTGLPAPTEEEKVPVSNPMNIAAAGMNHMTNAATKVVAEGVNMPWNRCG